MILRDDVEVVQVTPRTLNDWSEIARGLDGVEVWPLDQSEKVAWWEGLRAERARLYIREAKIKIARGKTAFAALRIPDDPGIRDEFLRLGGAVASQRLIEDAEKILKGRRIATKALYYDRSGNLTGGELLYMGCQDDTVLRPLRANSKDGDPKVEILSINRPNGSPGWQRVCIVGLPGQEHPENCNFDYMNRWRRSSIGPVLGDVALEMGWPPNTETYGSPADEESLQELLPRMRNGQIDEIRGPT